MVRKQRHEGHEQYPVEAALDLIGGKRKASIMFQLGRKTRRFGELRKRFSKITQRTLTKQLRELERDALVSRKIFAEVPPKVEYSITEFG